MEENSRMLTGFPTRSGEQIMVMMEISEEKLCEYPGFSVCKHPEYDQNRDNEVHVNTDI